MYAKVFAQIFDSSLREKWQAWVTFVALLVLADENDDVDMTLEALTARTGLPGSVVSEGIAWLEKPDPFSRSPESEGRRIIRLDDHRSWGWHIVNRRKYRSIRDNTERREYFRIHKQQQRACPPESTNVHPSPPHKDVDVDKDKNQSIARPAVSLRFIEFWEAYPRKVSKALALKKWLKLNADSDPLFSAIMAGLVRAKEAWAASGTETQFLPHPATWLNQERWNDEIQPQETDDDGWAVTYRPPGRPQ